MNLKKITNKYALFLITCMTDPIRCEYAIYCDEKPGDHPHVMIHKITNCSYYKQMGNDGYDVDGKIHWFHAETFEETNDI